MGFSALVRAGVALANKLTTDLQVPVTHQAWIGQKPDAFGDNDPFGSGNFASPVTRMAIVEPKRRLMKTASGQEVMSFVSLTFLTPIEDTVATHGNDRQNPVDPRDQFVLPDGSTGDIVDINGMLSGETQEPYMTVVLLGAKR